MMASRCWTIGFGAILASASGCGDSDAGDGGTGAAGGGGTVDPESQVVQRFQTFTESGFERVTAEGASTQHGLAELVHIWASEEAAVAYRAVDPLDAEGTAPPFAVDSMLVKQNLDAAGQPTGGATVLAKQAAGYNPDAGDWFWGRFGDNGSLVEGGTIAFCIECHAANGLEATDWVNGVPADNQQ